MFYLLISLSLFLFFIPSEYLKVYNYLLQKNNNNHLSVIHQLMKFTLNYLYIYISQHIFHNSILINKHIYDIEYSINCKIYRFRTSYKKGPSKYSQFIDHTGQDISEYIFKYVGPNDDFHNINYTPTDFNCSSMIIIYYNGTQQIFNSNDIISNTQLFDENNFNDISSENNLTLSENTSSPDMSKNTSSPDMFKNTSSPDMFENISSSDMPENTLLDNDKL